MQSFRKAPPHDRLGFLFTSSTLSLTSSPHILILLLQLLQAIKPVDNNSGIEPPAFTWRIAVVIIMRAKIYDAVTNGLSVTSNNWIISPLIEYRISAFKQTWFTVTTWFGYFVFNLVLFAYLFTKIFKIFFIPPWKIDFGFSKPFKSMFRDLHTPAVYHDHDSICLNGFIFIGDHFCDFEVLSFVPFTVPAAGTWCCL